VSSFRHVTRVAALAKINGEIDLFVIALREREKRSEALSRNASAMELHISKGSVFIAMPMFPEDRQLDDVHDAIKEVATSLGLSAKRVDDDETNERITDRVIDSLRTAEFVVADLTHNRPNVYYEAGYAHACNKIPIYIARQGTKIEFDLKDYPVIFFENLRQLKADLTKRLAGLIASSPKKPLEFKGKDILNYHC
jgi:nucleoside 2-deoxyribosyltransferase